MELAKTDYQNETELSAAREMIERRDAELARLREELCQSKEDAATQRTFNTETVSYTHLRAHET